MGCGGPWASAWNLGNHGNGPRGDNKHGMEFQHSQPGHGGMGKFGKVFLFLTQDGEGTGGSRSVPNKSSLCRTPLESQAASISQRLCYHFFSFLVFITHLLPPRIPWGTSHSQGVSVHSKIPVLMPT